jgi:ketosteroid isomerase-like protein
MSQANVEVAKRGMDPLNQRDVDTLSDLCTLDIELLPAMSGAVDGGSLRGRDGVETLLADIREAWEEQRLIADEFRDLGNRVLGLGRLEGRGRVSGVRVDAPLGVIFDFRDGKIAQVRTYLDHGEALRAAGLSE